MSSELDRKAEMVLESIYQHGGEAEMGEIKEYTGIEKNGVIRYRLTEKLEPMGLIEMGEVTRSGALNETVARLTDEGDHMVGRVIESDSGPTLAERMNILTNEVEDMVEKVELYEGMTESMRETIDELDDPEQVAEEVKEELQLEIGEIEEKAREDRGDMRRKLKEIESTVEELSDLDDRVSEIEAKLNRLDIPEPQPEDLDGLPEDVIDEISGEGEVDGEGEEDAEDEEESSKADKLLRYVKQLDLDRDGIHIKGKSSLRAHLKEQFPGASEEDLDEVTERVTLKP